MWPTAQQVQQTSLNNADLVQKDFFKQNLFPHICFTIYALCNKTFPI